MRDYDECSTIKDLIKHVTFLDSIEPAERKLQNYFAYNLHQYIINETSHVNP